MNKANDTSRLRVAIHKFSSCDGCQLPFLNLGEELVQLAGLVDIVHFVEAGKVAPDVEVDVAFVEGSISTPREAEHVKQVRAASRLLVPIGACATAGGPQALRNLEEQSARWPGQIYAQPEYIASLDTATPISEHVSVDFELWGCPVNSRQILAVLRAVLDGINPTEERDKVCIECKRQQRVCVLVAGGKPCLGPVTRTGCGALCPNFERDCYGCYGPAEAPNTASLVKWFRGLGLVSETAAERFMFQNSAAPPFKTEAKKRRKK